MQLHRIEAPLENRCFHSLARCSVQVRLALARVFCLCLCCLVVLFVSVQSTGMIRPTRQSTRATENAGTNETQTHSCRTASQTRAIRV